MKWILCMALATLTTLYANTYTVVTVMGKVTDYKTKQPTSVTISFYDLDGKKIGWSKSNSRTGQYLVTGLKPGEAYIIRIESVDYMRDEYEVILPKVNEHIEIVKDFEAIPR